MTNLPVPFTCKFDVTAAGTPEQLGVKIEEITIAFVEGGDNVNDTITDSGNGFLAAGFQAGDEIIVTGTQDNDGTYQIESVTAGTITLQSRNDLVAEAAGSAFRIRARKFVPDGIQVVIKGKAANTGQIYIADTEAKADGGVGAFELDAVEEVRLQLTELADVWIDAATTGEGVEVIFESQN